MNFKFLQPFLKLRKLYEYCCEAEEFALTKPSTQKAAAFPFWMKTRRVP